MVTTKNLEKQLFCDFQLIFNFCYHFINVLINVYISWKIFTDKNDSNFINMLLLFFYNEVYLNISDF